MPRVGMRIVKSAAAVFLCFVVDMFRGSGIPFYSAIAAVLCMQPYVSGSLRVAANRVIATLTGGFAGMLVLFGQRRFFAGLPPLAFNLCISLCIIPLIYLTVLFKKPSASYITCVVFLSVTVTHGGDVSPALFALNRILDTLIGILVSLGVNAFHLPRHRNRDILFVSDMDGTLLNGSSELSTYTKVRLNHLLERGAKITVASARTPATLVPLLAGVELSLPVIAMNGAVLYNIKENRYLACKKIPYHAAREVRGVFGAHGRNCFVQLVQDDALQIYYSALQNPQEKKFYEARRLLPLKKYICADPPPGKDPVYLTVIDTRETVEALRCEVEALGCARELAMICYPCEEGNGYWYLEICRADVSKRAAVEQVQKQAGALAVAAFGDNLNDLPMLQGAEYPFAVSNAQPQVREAVQNHIGSNDSDAVVKAMWRLYFARRLEKWGHHPCGREDSAS